MLVVLLGLWLVRPPSLLAAPAFAPPSGWDDGAAADARAQRRANGWAQAWGADVRQVMSTRSTDDFAETLAILDVSTPIPAEALTRLDAGRTWLEPRVSAALGATVTLDPEGLELRPRPQPGVAVLLGRARVGDGIARIAVAPNGARHVAVVLLVPEAEEVLHAHVFDDAVEGLDGLRPPVAPFRLDLARAAAGLAWLLVGGAFAFVWVRRALPMPGAGPAGRQVALVLGAVALLVLVLVGSFAGDVAVELALAGSSPWGLALELALGGAVVAIVALVVTALLDRRVRPVASAPQAGSFAVSRRSTSELPVVGSPPLRPAITGDTQVGRPPAITGDTQVGRPPAITGDTQVGRAPAITGNTKVGPPPQPIPLGDYEAGPPMREIISGDIEVNTQVRRAPQRDPVKTAAPAGPRLAAIDLVFDEDTNPRATAGADEEPASLADPHERPADAPVDRRPHRAAQSDLFPRVEPKPRPGADDHHPALDAPRPEIEIDWS
jgi:hypothetical protein